MNTEDKNYKGIIGKLIEEEFEKMTQEKAEILSKKLALVILDSNIELMQFLICDLGDLDAELEQLPDEDKVTHYRGVIATYYDLLIKMKENEELKAKENEQQDSANDAP